MLGIQQRKTFTHGLALGRIAMTRNEKNHEQLIGEWQEAFRAANGREAPEIQYQNGWYIIKRLRSKFRRKQLEEMIFELKRRSDK